MRQGLSAEGHPSASLAYAFVAVVGALGDASARADRFVPDGMTRLGDIDHTNKKVKIRRTLATAQARWNDRVQPFKGRKKQAFERKLTVRPPLPHHSDYFAQLWRGIDSSGNPLPDGHPWQGLRQKVMTEFRAGAVRQVQEMGSLDPALDFQYKDPDRNQTNGWDGCMFRMPKNRKGPAIGEHYVGGDTTKRVHGTKFTIASTRISGQYHSRVIIDLVHTGRGRNSRAKTEQQAVLEMTPIIGALSEQEIRGKVKRGLKSVLVDCVVRGTDVIEMQRASYHVVNHPHTGAYPDRGPGKRLNATRVEKHYLRRAAVHDDRGEPCVHFIYAMGGDLVQIVEDEAGGPGVSPLERLEHKERINKDGTYQHYSLRKVECAATGTSFTERIALFHTDPTSSDLRYNWGEVCRVFPPSSPEFPYLYGQRNDTESRHTDLKARAKYLPADVPGQELRLLAASMLLNAIAWQVHLQAHHQPNVFDDTA